MAEFSADRAGLLVCQNLKSAISALMKISGYPPADYYNIDVDHFIKQADEFKNFDSSTLDKIAKFAGVLMATHPWSVMRAHEMLSWFRSGAYGSILSRGGPPSPEPNAEIISDMAQLLRNAYRSICDSEPVTCANVHSMSNVLRMICKGNYSEDNIIHVNDTSITGNGKTGYALTVDSICYRELLLNILILMKLIRR